MILLLDTHIFIALLNDQTEQLPLAARRLCTDKQHALAVSVATFWEMAIKWRLGKLEFGATLDDLPDFAHRSAISMINVNAYHVLAQALPEPPTRDPFDRMLLAQCLVEGLKLITIDRALADHPLSATHP